MLIRCFILALALFTVAWQPVEAADATLADFAGDWRDIQNPAQCLKLSVSDTKGIVAELSDNSDPQHPSIKRAWEAVAVANEATDVESLTDEGSEWRNSSSTYLLQSNHLHNTELTRMWSLGPAGNSDSVVLVYRHLTVNKEKKSLLVIESYMSTTDGRLQPRIFLERPYQKIESCAARSK